MKRCSDCLQVRDLEDFAFKSRGLGIRQGRCRTCLAIRARAHYQLVPGRYKARAAAAKPRILQATRQALRAYLQGHACVDCGGADLAVLEFDHRGPKRNTVSDLVRRAASWALVAAEIGKCDVVCANCHRRRTARQFGWYKLTAAEPDLPPLPPRGSPAYERVKNYRNRVRRRFTNRARLLAYLREHPCTECGIDDVVVLDFDHQRDKTHSVAELVNDRGWIAVLAEIRKCHVLCANCHRRRTAARAGRDR